MASIAMTLKTLLRFETFLTPTALEI